MANPPSTWDNVIVAFVSIDVASRSILPKTIDKAIEKHDACDAATISSGFVPASSSNRVLNPYGLSFKAPDSMETVPLPSFNEPSQWAEACLLICVMLLFLFDLLIKDNINIIMNELNKKVSDTSSIDKNIKLDDKFESDNKYVFDYGVFCIKLLVTLNSAALFAGISFAIKLIGEEGVEQYQVINNSFMISCVLSLTFIMMTTLITYLCHRVYNSMRFTWEKYNYPELYGKRKLYDALKVHAYNLAMYLSIILGVLSMITLLYALWKYIIALGNL